MTASMKKCLGVALMVVAVTACGSGTENDPTGRVWNLTELEGDAPVGGTTIDLTITEEGISGNAGCNTYNGSVELDMETSTLTVGPDVVSTMMACEEPIMAQEQKYFEALTRVTSYEVASEELILKDAEGIAVATFN
jgi:heat shock protein HslJ